MLVHRDLWPWELAEPEAVCRERSDACLSNANICSILLLVSSTAGQSESVTVDGNRPTQVLNHALVPILMSRSEPSREQVDLELRRPSMWPLAAVELHVALPSTIVAIPSAQAACRDPDGTVIVPFEYVRIDGIARHTAGGREDACLVSGR